MTECTGQRDLFSIRKRKVTAVFDEGLVTSDAGVLLLRGIDERLGLPPDPKWRRFLARSLPWLPYRFGHLLRQVELSPRTAEGVRIRREALLCLVDAGSRHARKHGDLGGDIYVRYLAEPSDHDPRA